MSEGKETRPDTARSPSPSQAPILRLLERLIATALTRRPPGERAPLRGVQLTDDGLVLHVALPDRLPDWLPGREGSQPLHLRIEDTNAEETSLRLELPRMPGVGRFVGWGLKNLPDEWLNELLGKVLTGTFRKRGDLLVLDHRALVKALLQR